jgi:AcrR family transcriptional regulator
MSITPAEADSPRRARLNRDRVLRAAVALADEIGIDALSMRKLSDELGVVPMALYKHVANKEELLDGMVDVIVGEIDPPVEENDWQSAVRRRILSARRSLLRHPWAPGVIESRTSPSPATIAYIDSMIGMLLAGGFTPDLTHHALHALGSRIYGFTQEVLNDSQSPEPGPQATAARELAMRFPHIVAMMAAIAHDRASYVGRGCDDQFEFEFALDLMLEGLEARRLRAPSPG